MSEVYSRIEDRVRSLEMASARHNGALTEIDGRLDRIEDRLDRLYLWLIGTAGGVAVTVVMLLLQVVIRR